ncbi:anthrone oxygenase family protein [Mangrovivirga cuniculi]|uniref:DUF1772 domain-containing protein n=1 Tax=Mangrovivirga cuniculi TaxID=2715131 RepID=A0A4D7JRD0_9BACT|nr:anthrone oxygenase family protein [Mangrovivirga cuniculi]QCK14276.1 DUF1772 domain-containing protein [Mangrovivirga cuniculi]
MELSFKSIILFGAVILTGLSAGLFYAWSVSVIPGTQKVSDEVYLQTMQSINRAILNPAFFTIFFGSLIVLGISTLLSYEVNKTLFSLLLASSIIYLVGPLAITGLGNVPLNDQLDNINISELSAGKASEFKQFYETKWNQLHLARTVLSVLSFILAVTALFVQEKIASL